MFPLKSTQIKSTPFKFTPFKFCCSGDDVVIVIVIYIDDIFILLDDGVRHLILEAFRLSSIVLKNYDFRRI